MAKQNYLDFVLYSLSDSTRRNLLRNLTKPLNATMLYKKVCRPRLAVGEFDSLLAIPKPVMSFPALTKHLRILEEARLIKKEKKGREFKYTLTPYAQFWVDEIDRMEIFINHS